MSRDFQRNAYQVTVGSLDLRANTMIKQIVEVVSDYDKYGRLCDHLKGMKDEYRVLVFVETKRGCDQLTRSLQVTFLHLLPSPSSSTYFKFPRITFTSLYLHEILVYLFIIESIFIYLGIILSYYFEVNIQSRL